MLIIYRNGYIFQVDPQRPFIRFKALFGGKPKKPKPPPTPAPPPTAQVVDEEARAKERDKRRQRIAAAGRGGTILTGGQSLASGSATILGRSTA